MCNNYASHVSAGQIGQLFAAQSVTLGFDGGVPNLEPRDDIRIGDTAPVVVNQPSGPALRQMKWAWMSPQGRPVFNFRSDGRRFESSARCLIPADGFYEFTDAEAGQKRKTKWRVTLRNEPWFWIAGIVRDSAWAMLTTEPGPDIRPYHDRQIVVLRPDQAMDWLNLTTPETELLRPLRAGSLAVEKVFPSA